MLGRCQVESQAGRRAWAPLLLHAWGLRGQAQQPPRPAWSSRRVGYGVSPSFATAAATAGAGTLPSAAAAAAEKAAASQGTAQQKQHLQTVDYTTLRAAVAELQAAWVPAKVEQALQVDAQAAAVRLRSLSGSTWLHLSWAGPASYLSLGPAPERGSVAEAFGFGEQLHAAVQGLVLTGVSMPQQWERVVRLEMAERPGAPPTQLLYHEVQGRYSNLVLCSGDGKVLAAGHQVGSKMSSLRQVHVSSQYALPPPAGGVDPDSCSSQAEWRDIVCRAAQQAAERSAGSSASVAGGCVRAFRGVSPSLMDQLCHTAGLAPEADPAALEEQQWESLHAQWQLWLERMQSGSFAACRDPSSGAYSVLGTYPQQQEASALEMLHSYFSTATSDQQFEAMQQRMRKCVASAQQRLQKKLQSLDKQGGAGDKHLQTQKLADMLMANVYRIERGVASVELEDWDTGEVVVMALDPLKPAVEAAEALYKQARKQRRAVDQVAPLIEEGQQQLEYLAEVDVMLSQLEAQGGMALLQEVQAELVAGKFMKPPPELALAGKAASKSKRAKKRAGEGGASARNDYRRYESPSGFPVLIGRNSAQNDQLTLKSAQPWDVWMHARGVPGSHLLLRVPPGKEASDADILFAANLCAFFSKLRTDGKVEVTVVADPVKSIYKAPRGKPGQVVVRPGRERVVLARPDQSAAALAPPEP